MSFTEASLLLNTNRVNDHYTVYTECEPDDIWCTVLHISCSFLLSFFPKWIHFLTFSLNTDMIYCPRRTIKQWHSLGGYLEISHDKTIIVITGIRSHYHQQYEFAADPTLKNTLSKCFFLQMASEFLIHHFNKQLW